MVNQDSTTISQQDVVAAAFRSGRLCDDEMRPTSFH
jgi:hypothetical protein